MRRERLHFWNNRPQAEKVRTEIFFQIDTGDTKFEALEKSNKKATRSLEEKDQPFLQPACRFLTLKKKKNSFFLWHFMMQPSWSDLEVEADELLAKRVVQ